MVVSFPSQYADFALLFMRVVVALVFASSGWSHLKDPAERAKSIGMSKPFTIFLGAAEVAGGLGLTFGVLAQFAALGLVLIGLGAMEKKIFEWKTEFWGEDGYGWSYDLIFLSMNLVIIATGGGAYVLF